MKGAGPEWEAIERLFELWCDRLGFRGSERSPDDSVPTTFRRPVRVGALMLPFRSEEGTPGG